MREDLVGYLLNALDDAERRRLEQALADPGQAAPLRRQLDVLARAVQPLDRDRDSIPPPPGLAARTLAFVAAQAPAHAPAHPSAAAARRPGPRPRPRSLSPVEGEWSGERSRAWLDRAIMAATALAACLLVGPLLLDSISQARARRAERNLQQLSVALQGYAESHGLYPTPPGEGPLSRAGLYAPTLVSEERLVAADGTVLSPESALSRSGRFRVPSLEEVQAAVGTAGFEEIVRSMGGDYGYTLGHRDAAGRLQPNRNQRRKHHPILADAPDETGERSDNHPDGLHHLLFEDGHVERLRADALHRGDHLYRNHTGRIAAGVDDEDAVIGDSHHQP